jgi:hypothetical protein
VARVLVMGLAKHAEGGGRVSYSSRAAANAGPTSVLNAPVMFWGHEQAA